MAKAKTDEKAMMVKLSDTTLVFTDPAQDIRGRKVVDRNGEEIGRLDDLFVDQGEEKVRFLEVSSGGFLGLGETKFLIPVDAITGIGKDEVHIDKTREHVAGAPRYSPELVDRRFVTSMYDYYGYAPYWGTGYLYPPYPYYPPMP
ncbi:MAG TPA: PRC-barrel domain-containing protein [Blastocatellia bacterium]|nr:PRC-barrel domain-containing protein [Blastocatellia bacterium]